MKDLNTKTKRYINQIIDIDQDTMVKRRMLFLQQYVEREKSLKELREEIIKQKEKGKLLFKEERSRFYSTRVIAYDKQVLAK